MSEVEEIVTTLELDEETFEEIYRVRLWNVLSLNLLQWKLLKKAFDIIEIPLYGLMNVVGMLFECLTETIAFY